MEAVKALLGVINLCFSTLGVGVVELAGVNVFHSCKWYLFYSFVDGFVLTCALFGLGADHCLLILLGCGSH